MILCLVKTKKKQVEQSKINEYVEQFSSFELLLSESTLGIRNALRWSEQHQNSFWDSLLAATILCHGITTIYTENEKDFKKLGLKTVNPLYKNGFLPTKGVIAK